MADKFAAVYVMADEGMGDLNTNVNKAARETQHCFVTVSLTCVYISLTFLTR